jgi:hypothetical protein
MRPASTWRVGKPGRPGSLSSDSTRAGPPRLAARLRARPGAALQKARRRPPPRSCGLDATPLGWAVPEAGGGGAPGGRGGRALGAYRVRALQRRAGPGTSQARRYEVDRYPAPAGRINPTAGDRRIR